MSVRETLEWKDFFFRENGEKGFDVFSCCSGTLIQYIYTKERKANATRISGKEYANGAECL